MTCEYFSTINFSVTLTEFILDTFPTSFRPKSNNIKCSASSFLSFISCFLKNSSSFFVEPLGLVPAIGLTVTLLFLSLTSISGLLPMI